jgi:hypothetical protein
VSEQTIEAPRSEAPPPPRDRPPASRFPLGGARSYVLVAVGVAVLLGVSLALIVWAKTRPGYDPYGWMVWGYQTLHGSLDLGGAPSWKPLPYVFDVPYALFGHYQLWLWMTSSVAVSLAGCLFAGRIAYRLTRNYAVDSDRWPALAAGVFAGAALLGLQSYMHYILSVQSDTMITTLGLAAIDAYISGHPKLAFVVGCVAGLGRPEVWSTLAPATVWLWFKRPSMRLLLVGGWIVVLGFWFGVPTVTNNRPFLAEQLALKSPRELHQNKIIGTIHRFTALTWLPVQLGALVALAMARWRRNWTVLLLGLSAVTWVVVEIILVLRGLPGVPRYLFEPAAIETSLAGAALGWILIEIRRASVARAIRAVGALAALALVVPMVPAALARVRDERSDLKHERLRTTIINRLSGTINAVGGYKRVRACGHPVTNVEYVSILAWYTHLNVGKVGYLPQRELKKPYPIVLFTQLHSGWQANVYHEKGAAKAACASMNARWLYTRRHPRGVLVPLR